MNWISLTTEEQLEEIRANSKERAQVIFKHSIRCSISSVAKNRLEKSIASDQVDFYYLDLVNNRSLSNKITEVFDIWHESPQILVIKNGACVYDESHMGISMPEILKQAL